MSSNPAAITGRRGATQPTLDHLRSGTAKESCSKNAVILLAVCIVAILFAKDLVAYFVNKNSNVLSSTTELVPIDVRSRKVELEPLSENDEANAKYTDGASFADNGLEEGSLTYNQVETEGAPRPISLPPGNAPVAFPESIGGRYNVGGKVRETETKIIHGEHGETK